MHAGLLELLPPGAIDHALEASLFDPQNSNLLIVRGNIIEIYKVAKTITVQSPFTCSYSSKTVFFLSHSE